MVPAEGFEPPTFGLQNRCTTTVLSRLTLNKVERLNHFTVGVSSKKVASPLCLLAILRSLGTRALQKPPPAIYIFFATSDG